jgi:hypothetical protein
MTIAQIARHLGIDWSSVRDRLYRAHRKLRFPTSGVEQTARRLGWVLPVFRKKLRNGDELLPTYSSTMFRASPMPVSPPG